MPGLVASRQALVQLLDYDVGGRVYRFATSPISITAASGQVYRYESGLELVELGMVRDFGAREVAVTVHSLIDWRKIEARGIALDDRRVVLRWYASGQALEQCDVALDGRVEGVAHMGQGEPITLQVVADTDYGAFALPGAQAVVSDQTWPVRALLEVSQSGEGTSYPIPVGYPGDHPKPGAVVDIAEPAYPSRWVEKDPIGNTPDHHLLALGRIDAEQITLFADLGGAIQSVDLPVFESNDGLDVLVSLAEVRIADDDTGQTFYAGMRRSSGWGGGIISPYTGQALNGAGEVFRYFVDYFTDERIDEARLIAYQPWFDRFKIDVVMGLQGSETPPDFLRRAVLDVLPGVMVYGPDGLYLAPLRWDAQKHQRVAHIDLDTSAATLDGSLSRWDEPVLNRFTIEYRPRYGDQYVSRRELTSIQQFTAGALTGGARFPPLSTSLPWYASAEQDLRVAGSSLLRRSQARFGLLEADPLKLASCWHDDTANLILWYQALRYAWPKRIGRMTGRHLSTLLPGDVITLTQTENRLQEHVALVLDRVPTLSTVAIDFVVLDAPGEPRCTS